MAEFSRLVITGKGQALLAKMIAEGCSIEFTKVSASGAEYTDAQLEGLTELSEIRQTSLISRITRTNEVAIKVEAAFTNTELTEGYYMRALGLYANDSDAGEILYAVTREVSGNCYMPAYNGVTVSGAYVQLVIAVGNAENVTLEVDSGAYATMGDIKTLEAKISELNGQLGGAGASGDIGFAEGIEADNVIGAINEVFQSGNEKKGKLVENLVAMGIEASTDETWEVLLGKIQNISTDAIHYLGERNSSDVTNNEYRYNLKDLYPDDYMNFTEDDFIVGVRENSGVGSQTVREPGTNVYGRADGFNLKVTYDPNTGILSITDFTITAYIAKYEDGSVKKCNNPGTNSSVVFAYLIADATLFKNVVDTSGDTVSADTLLSGYTAHNAAGEQITGAMPDKRGTTVTAAAVTQDDEYTYLSLPEGEACYNGDSKVRTNIQATKKSLYFPEIGIKTYDPSATPNNSGYTMIYVKDFTSMTIEEVGSNIAIIGFMDIENRTWTDGGGTHWSILDPETNDNGTVILNTPSSEVIKVDISKYNYINIMPSLGRYSSGHTSGNGYGVSCCKGIRIF